MRSNFTRQLEELDTQLVSMGMLCEKSIGLASQMLSDNRLELVDLAEKTEDLIDAKEKEIENLCLRLFLQQQPVASDLRIISACLKMISDMERIGDQACDIVEVAWEMNGQEISYGDFTLKYIEKMADHCSLMLTQGLDAFVSRNIGLALAVRKNDCEIDSLFARVKKELSTAISAAPGNGEICIDLLMIAKYFERIGDHAVNIAEWVEFSITGSHGEKIH